jgi:lactate permease
MNARILPFTSVLVPIWLLLVMVGLRETLEVLPAALICGVSFAVVQFLWGNFVDAGLVDIVAGLASLLSLAGFLLVWKPRRVWRFPEEPEGAPHGEGIKLDSLVVLRAWLPFLILLTFVISWGLLKARYGMDKLEWGPVRAAYEVPIPGLHQKVLRTLPVVKEAKAEDAIFNFNWLSATGTAVLLACLTTCVLLGHGPRRFARSFLTTCRRMKTPILAIVPMLGLGFLTRYSGLDAILGLAFTKTGPLYPIFGTYLGWLGVALTGSDTASNALFGSLQRITAEQLKISPVLMCSANSAGGVMGKMVDAQSIVVAAAASGETGEEGKILAAVFWHSIALAAVVALIVLLYAYVFPGAVPSGVKLLG